MTTTTVREFQVKRDELTTFRTVEHQAAPLANGEIRLAVDMFAFTANNVTYGAAGDLLGYWQFFPTADDALDEWGILPVWGFANVVDSTINEVVVGDRLYGYFPPATSLVLTPTNVSNSTLQDGAAHRQALPPLYNRYQRVSNQARYKPEHDDATALLSPLHLTSFCLVDQLDQNTFYNAVQVVIVSASSKTSLGTAYGLSEHEDSPRIIGLTSDRNHKFVEDTGLYDDVVTYDTIDKQLAAVPTVVIDMAGNPAVTSALASRLGNDLAHYIAVGLTHWGEQDSRGEKPKVRIERFFAPSYIQERVQTMEFRDFDRVSREFVTRSAIATSAWMQIDRLGGLPALAEVYTAVANGDFPPSTGLIVKMNIGEWSNESPDRRTQSS